MACSDNPSQIRCTQVCGVERPCCSKRCPARCWECKELSRNPQLPQLGRITRANHVRHPCGKDLFCQHTCEQSCAVGHVCDDCTSECRQSCIHHRCERGCSTPCTPCAEPCPWTCPHQSCPVPCGSVRSPTPNALPPQVTDLPIGVHSPPLRFALPEKPPMRPSLFVALWRTMRRSALHRVCVRRRKGGSGGPDHAEHNRRSRYELERTR